MNSPIHPSELPANCTPRDVRRMLASWRGHEWPPEVRIIHRLYRALNEQAQRFEAALDEVYALERVIDDTRQRMTTDTPHLIQEAKEKRATSAFLGQLWREKLADAPKRQTAAREAFGVVSREWEREKRLAAAEEERKQRETA